MKNKSLKLFKLLFVSLLVSLSCLSQGATIARVGTDELVNNAELIFEGVVLSITPQANQRGYIYTYVSFQVNEVLVGDDADLETVTLRFTGGTVNGMTLDVGVKLPQLNEHGIYFVERVAPGLINPLLGWSQGHFTVNQNGQVIAGNTETVQKVESRSSAGVSAISEELADGIITIESNQPAMTLAVFKRAIRALKR